MSFADVAVSGDTGGDWKKDYAKVKDLVIALRAAEPGAELGVVTRAVEALTRDLRRAETNPKAAKLTEAELVRRKELVLAVQRQLEAAKDRAKIESLTQIGAGGGEGVAQGELGASPQSQAGTRSLLQAQAKEVIKEQDLILDDIEKGVERLKERGLAIKEETATQLKTLDKADLQVDAAEAAVRVNTEKAEQVRAASTSWSYYLCVGILVAVLLLLIIVGYGTPRT